MRYLKIYEEFVTDLKKDEEEGELNEGLKSMAAGVLVALASILPNKSLAQKAEKTDVEPTRTEMELAQKIKKDLENKAYTVEVDTLINVQPGDSVYANIDGQRELIDLQQGIRKKYFDEKGDFLGNSYEIDTKFQGGKSDKWASAVGVDGQHGVYPFSNSFDRSEISKASAYQAYDLSDKLFPEIDSYFKIAYESVVEDQETGGVTKDTNYKLRIGREEIDKKIEEIKRINSKIGEILESSFKNQLNSIWSDDFSEKEAPKFKKPF